MLDRFAGRGGPEASGRWERDTGSAIHRPSPRSRTQRPSNETCWRVMSPFSSIPLSSLQVQAGRIRSLPHVRDDAPCLCFLHPRPSRNRPDLCTGLSSASRVMNRGRLPSSMDWSAPSSGSQSSAPSARTEPPWEASFPRSLNCLCSSSPMRFESRRLAHAAPAG